MNEKTGAERIRTRLLHGWGGMQGSQGLPPKGQAERSQMLGV